MRFLVRFFDALFQHLRDVTKVLGLLWALEVVLLSHYILLEKNTKFCKRDRRFYVAGAT